MMRLWALVAAAMMVAASPAVAQKNDDGVIGYAADDAEMNAARAEAVRTLPTFLAHLAQPADNEQRFMIKFDLLDAPDEAEHIWAEELSIAPDGTITGHLANVPMTDGFALGQRVTISRSAVSDWAYFRDRVMQGSFTTRVMLRDMPPAQAAEIKAAFGW